MPSKRRKEEERRKRDLPTVSPEARLLVFPVPKTVEEDTEFLCRVDGLSWKSLPEGYQCRLLIIRV